MTGSLVSSLLSRGGSGGGSWPMSKVIVKANSLPTAEIKYVGSMYIYAGETTAAYKHGYIYEGTSTPANTKTVSFSPNTISCTGENFWAFWKSEDGAPNNYTEIIKGEMVLGSETAWTLVGRNTNNEIVKSYQQNQSAWEALGFSFTGTFSEGDSVGFSCAINETDDIIYWWQRIDVQPAGTSSSTGIAVDGQLSFDSQNPVQNKVITEALKDTGYDTWKKPEDWIDIRSGALDNSIYFLVAHSVPTESEGTYTVDTYPQFKIRATISNSGTYDVYVDGVKVATTNSNTFTTLDWGALYTDGTIATGFNVTHPSTLTTHVVRMTPTIATNTITAIRLDSSISEYGLLWLHFQIANAISLNYFSGSFDNSYVCKLLEAVTSQNDELQILTGINFRYAYSLKHLPLLIGQNDSVSCDRGFYNSYSLKKIRLKNIILTGNQGFYNSNIELFETENAYFQNHNSTFQNCVKLKRLPPFNFEEKTYGNNFVVVGSALQPSVVDARGGSKIKTLGIRGTSEDRADGIKVVIVSNEAPFDGTSPQLSVSYTGLDRAALVNLFKSMPYNVGYTVVGSPTIVDGVASAFSANDYLQLNLIFPHFTGNDNIEIGTKVNFSSLSSLGANIFGKLSGNDGVNIVISSSVLYGYCLNSTTNSRIYARITDLTININTDYYILYSISNNVLSISLSTDKQTWNTGTLNLPEGFSYSDNVNSVFGGWKGSSAYQPFSTGSIDLNETYIKVNGVPWFTGKAAMTKTCSIVGCTGTADLTQEDKNIVLNKGWELTVA